MSEITYTIAKNGRYAILARKEKTQPWTLIESIMDENTAIQFVKSMNDDKINDYIDEELASDDPWPDSHQPIVMPK